MPSLNELKEFKASFHHIGGQKANLAAKKAPLDDLELPNSEPQPLPSPAEATATATTATAEPESAIDPEDGIDFSAFLDSDLPTDELNPPEELLSNLSEELDAIPPDFPDEPPAADGGDTPLDLDSLDNFDMPEEPLAADSGDKPFDLGNLDTPEEPTAADGGDKPLDLDSLDNFDMPEEPVAADGGDESAPINLDSFDDFDMPAESAADGGESFNLDNLDMPDEPAAADSESLDLDNLGDLSLPEGTEEAAGGESPDLDSLGDLSLPEEPAESADSGSPDLDSLGDLSLPEEPAESADGESPDLDSLGDLSLPEEPAEAADGGSLDVDSLGDLSLPEEPTESAGGGSLDVDSLGDLSLPEEPAEAAEGRSPDLDSLGDLDLPSETPAADSEESPGGLDMPEEPAESADGGENLDIDKLDNLGDFDVHDETAAVDGEDGSPEPFDELAPTDNYDNIELDNLDDADFSAKPAGKAQAIDDFSFDELDDVLQKTHKKKEGFTAAPPPETKKRGKAQKKDRKKVKIDTKVDGVEGIQISEDELEGLLETLSRYPINLRIACEEIITGEIGSTKQIAELIEHLVWGATAKETAILASHILDKQIIVPKAFEKSSGAELEAEQASFSYIFIHRFLPVMRLFTVIALLAASCCYLFYRFVYTPLKAEAIYKIGYERIFAGEYERANERFDEAFAIYRKKDWFYKYAEAFRDERQYIYAEQKYDELLRYYPRDKKGVLDYANLETYYLRNYEKADNILRWNLLDYNPNDREGLLAAGDNCLVWGDIDPAKYEDARYYYARVLEQYGWQPPVVERMMKYFIRTDNLREVLPLKVWFDNNSRYELSAETLGELGGYLLDKQLEEVKGVPNEYVEQIGSVRDLLLKAVYADPTLPEPHYHLARYYQNLGSAHEELVSLRVANSAFDKAPEGSIRRINYRLDAVQRYADALINNREFFPAEEQLVKGINLYEDFVSRRLIPRSAKYGRLYAVMGDLEYFTKTGDMDAALRFYHRSEQDGWAPPEMQYRMGAAYYHLENWRNSLEYLFAASKNLPLNRRILFALGNAALKRGDYFAANGYYNRLLDILENQRSRLPILLPNDRPEYLELAERLMMAQNNAGVTSEMLAAQTGNRTYHTRALAFYAEANRAWDARTRDPRSMIRSGSTPLPFLNSRNALYPQAGYEPQIFIRIDREAQENSPWEELASLPRPDPDRND